MMKCALLLVVSLAGVFLNAPPSLAIDAEIPCEYLLKNGGRVMKSYVMDFGPRDKLWVYVMQMSNGDTQTCTSQKPLKK